MRQPRSSNAGRKKLLEFLSHPQDSTKERARIEHELANPQNVLIEELLLEMRNKIRSSFRIADPPFQKGMGRAKRDKLEASSDFPWISGKKFNRQVLKKGPKIADLILFHRYIALLKEGVHPKKIAVDLQMSKSEISRKLKELEVAFSHFWGPTDLIDRARGTMSKPFKKGLVLSDRLNQFLIEYGALLKLYSDSE